VGGAREREKGDTPFLKGVDLDRKKQNASCNYRVIAHRKKDLERLRKGGGGGKNSVLKKRSRVSTGLQRE